MKKTNNVPIYAAYWPKAKLTNNTKENIIYIDETPGGDLCLVMQDTDDIRRVHDALLLYNIGPWGPKHPICKGIIDELFDEAGK